MVSDEVGPLTVWPLVTMEVGFGHKLGRPPLNKGIAQYLLRVAKLKSQLWLEYGSLTL